METLIFGIINNVYTALIFVFVWKTQHIVYCSLLWGLVGNELLLLSAGSSFPSSFSECSPSPSLCPFFVSLSLSLCTEVFVNFHLCKHIIIRGVRCLVIQLHLTSLETVILKTLLLILWIVNRCQTLPVAITLYPSFFYADDYPDCPQCFSHMTVVIQLVTESAPKPSQCRLVQEKYRVGDYLSTRAFPASCNFSINIVPSATAPPWPELTRNDLICCYNKKSEYIDRVPNFNFLNSYIPLDTHSKVSIGDEAVYFEWTLKRSMM